MARRAEVSKDADETGAQPASKTSREDTQRSIQSVEFGFRLIRCLEEAAGPLSLKELSARAGMAASKAHLYLVSFRRVGMVVQEEGSGRYNLGPYALQLGLASLRKLDIGRLGRAALQELSSEAGEASYLAVWGNRGPCIVMRVDGPRPIPMSLQVGYVLPVVPTATGRIFLSYLPRSVTAAVVEQERAGTDPRSANIEEAELAKIIGETQSRGISRTDGLLNIGFTALSAPVLAHDGALAGAITVIGPSGGIDTSLTGRTARMLRSAAEGLNAQMGWKTSA
ncbi:MAG: IclR family transcriptional regulator [Caulobacteraceae bacterium]